MGFYLGFLKKNEVSREKVRDVLGEKFSYKLISEKNSLQVDDSFNSFFEKCHLVNDLLETKGLLLRVYERRDKFRYLIKKGVSGKNNVVRDFPSCLIQKFNRYEISRHQLKRQQKCFLELIDIVYKPVKDDGAIACFFTSTLHLAFRYYFSRKLKNNQFISNLTTRKCYYCSHFFC